MATSSVSEAIQHLRRSALRRDGAGMSDGELLERFVRERDNAALAGLVQRHGPMVWGVCRRVLPHHHEAEDAFQATFLVLVRKAASVVPREMVVNWLYGVAYQTARKARATLARRRSRERQVMIMPEPAAQEQELDQGLQPLLDQELSRLPDKYRVAILLCDLEGKTRREAASQLRVPEGTLSGRLTRGRAMLARRLTRRGLALSAGSLAGLLWQNTASAAVPASVTASTIQAAAVLAAGQTAAAGLASQQVIALAEGVLKAMLLSKLKIISATLLLFAALTVGAGGLIYQSRISQAAYGAHGPSRHAAAPQHKGKQDRRRPNTDEIKQELEKLQGTWIGNGGEYKGKQASEEDNERSGHRLVISGEKFRWFTALSVEPISKGTLKIDPTRKPKTLDMVFEQGPASSGKCIYQLDGDTLKVCYAEMARPTQFRTTASDADTRLYVWKRDLHELKSRPITGDVEDLDEWLHRQVRWRLVFNTKDGEDYARQLQALGAILAIPEPGDRKEYRVFRDLKKRPATGKIEDLSKIDRRLNWVDDEKTAVEGLAKALGLKSPPAYFIALFPEKLEKDLARKERSFADRYPDGIDETVFKISKNDKGEYEARVISQRVSDIKKKK